MSEDRTYEEVVAAHAAVKAAYDNLRTVAFGYYDTYAEHAEEIWTETGEVPTLNAVLVKTAAEIHAEMEEETDPVRLADYESELRWIGAQVNVKEV